MSAAATDPPPGGPRRSGLLRNSLISVGASFVLPLTALVTGPLLARVLGPEGRGQLVTVLAPIMIMSFVASTGVLDATIFSIGRRGVPYARVTRAASGLLLAYGAVGVGVLWAVAPLLARQDPRLVDDLRIAALALPLLMLALMQRFALNGQRWYRLANLERVSAALLRLGALVGQAVLGVLTVVTAAWANIGSSIAAALLLLVISRRRLRREAAAVGDATAVVPDVAGDDAAAPAAVPVGPATRADATPEGTRDAERPAGERGEAAFLARYGLRAWGSVLGNLVNWRVDQALLALLVAPRHVGYYAVAVSLSELPGAAAGVVKNVIFAEGSTRDDPLVAARAARTIGAVLAVCAVGGVLLAGPAVVLLFGEPFRPAVPLAQVLFVATVPFVVEQAVGAGLLAAGRPGLRTIGQLVSATITVVALVVLVPVLGPMGAAVTSLLAYTVNAAMAVAFFHRVSGLPVGRIVLVRREDVAALLRPLRRLRRGRSGPRDGSGT